MQRFQHAAGELVGVRRGGNHRGDSILLGLRPVLAVHVHRHGGVGVAEVALSVPQFPDSLKGAAVPAEAAVEQLLHLFPHGVAHGVHPGLGQVFHPARQSFAVLAAQVVEQAFQVAGNQNVHRGGRRGVEFPAAVVGAGADEVRQHLVGVGGAHQLADGQAHLPGVIGSQNVAEIPGGHHHVHGLAQDALPLPDKLQIGIDVVDDLGQQPAPVDGVGAGEQHAVRPQLFLELGVGKNLFHAGLGVVEVALEWRRQTRWRPPGWPSGASAWG